MTDDVLSSLPAYKRPIGATLVPGITDDAGNPVYQSGAGRRFTVVMDNAMIGPQDERSGFQRGVDNLKNVELPSWKQTRETITNAVKNLPSALKAGVDNLGESMFGGMLTTEDAIRLGAEVGVVGAGMPVPEGATRLFGGRRAKSAPFTEAEEADFDSYLDPDTLWEEKSVFRGPEGKYRFEISDENLAFTGDFTRRYKEIQDDLDLAASMKAQDPIKYEYYLDEVIDHPELFDNYPELKDVRVLAGYKTGDSSAGYWDEANKVLFMNMEYFDRGQELKFQSTLLHEIQHAIQYIEGFDVGSGPDMFESAFNQGKRDAWINAYSQLSRSSDPADQRIARKYLWGVGVEEAKRIRDAEGLTAFDTYQRTAGEVESRAVEKRFLMSNLPGFTRQDSPSKIIDNEMPIRLPNPRRE